MARLVLLGIVVALCLTTAAAQDGFFTAPADCKAQALTHHNYLRSVHQAPNLVWNDTLANEAQVLAASLAAQNCKTAGFAANQNSLTLSGLSYRSPCGSAVLSWYYEAANWTFTNTPVTDNPRVVTGSLYTFPFMVWSNTTQVGCGAAQQDIKNTDGCWSVVCRYSPAAEFPTDTPETNAAYFNNVKPPVVLYKLFANDSCSAAVLDVYNKHRADHQSPPIVWSETYAAGAQSWANQLADQGCPQKNDAPLFHGSVKIWPGGHPGDTVCDSFAEYQYWPAADYRFTNTPAEDNRDIGHVTRLQSMLSRSNTKIGCGRAAGSNGCWVVACWYDAIAFDDESLLKNVLPAVNLSTPRLLSCQQAALPRLNTHRANHSAPPLTWNIGFAAGYQSLATSTANNNCIVSLEAGSAPFGESAVLAFTSATDVCGLAIDLWYSLNNNTYNFTATPWTDNKLTFDTWRQFAQVIWRNTTQVGCGSAPGPNGCWVVYCKFDPAGDLQPNTVFFENSTQVNSKFLQNVLPGGALPPSAIEASSPNASSAAPDASSSTVEASKGKNVTSIVVGTCVVAGVVVATIAAAIILYHRKQQQQRRKDAISAWEKTMSPDAAETNTSTGYSGSAGPKDGSQSHWPAYNISGSTGMGIHCMDIPGLLAGEPFTRGTAFAYSWNKAYTAVPGVTQAVEIGVNDAQLDAMVQQSADGTVQDCPVVCLSKEQVKQQLQLLTDGLRGRGGAALVFQALWPNRFGPDALLAVKALKDGYDCNPYVLQSFAHEASVLASVRHPNVVRLYGYCLDPPNVCLIMELLPCSLKDVLYGRKEAAVSPIESAISSLSAQSEHVTGQTSQLVTPHSSREGVPLTMAQVLHISTEIAAGLAYLHEQPEQLLMSSTEDMALPAVAEVSPSVAEVSSAIDVEHAATVEPTAGNTQKIVHRDLKPANILINSRGQIKISDFGLARRHDSTTIDTHHVGAGTVPYQAPEIISGARAGAYGIKATNRCDVYSMAMIFWELLSRQPPWKDRSEVAILSQVINGKRPELPIQDKSQPVDGLPTDLTQLRASLNALPAFNDIIRQCWAQRELRRPTAAEAHRLLVELQQRCQTAATATMDVRVVEQP